MPPKTNPLQPVVRVAPLGELNAYAVYEHELDTLAKGSPSSHLLGISYALIPFSGGVRHRYRWNGYSFQPRLRCVRVDHAGHGARWNYLSRPRDRKLPE
jgi:hypothetical protein